MTTEIERMEILCSQMQMVKLDNSNKALLGIGWVLISLEKNMKEEQAYIKKWSV
jgi:hypothetical protein